MRRTIRELRQCENLPGADFTADETEFCMAIDRYKRTAGRPFPTWREVLMVLRSLGYSKQSRAAGAAGEAQKTDGRSIDRVADRPS